MMAGASYGGGFAQGLTAGTNAARSWIDAYRQAKDDAEMQAYSQQVQDYLQNNQQVPVDFNDVPEYARQALKDKLLVTSPAERAAVLDRVRSGDTSDLFLPHQQGAVSGALQNGYQGYSGERGMAPTTALAGTVMEGPNTTGGAAPSFADRNVFAAQPGQSEAPADTTAAPAAAITPPSIQPYPPQAAGADQYPDAVSRRYGPQMAAQPGNTASGPTAKQIADAIYGQESGSGSADTRGVNSHNVTGPMQMKEETFNGMKRLGQIPKDWDWKNPEQNKAAGYKHVEELYNQYGGDPAKVMAVYYSGPDAVRSDGSIATDRRDLKNAKAPTVGQYIDQVSARMGNTSPGAPSAPAAPSAISAPGMPPVAPGQNPRHAAIGDTESIGAYADRRMNESRAAKTEDPKDWTDIGKSRYLPKNQTIEQDKDGNWVTSSKRPESDAYRLGAQFFLKKGDANKAKAFGDMYLQAKSQEATADIEAIMQDKKMTPDQRAASLGGLLGMDVKRNKQGQYIIPDLGIKDANGNHRGMSLPEMYNLATGLASKEGLVRLLPHLAERDKADAEQRKSDVAERKMYADEQHDQQTYIQKQTELYNAANPKTTGKEPKGNLIPDKPIQVNMPNGRSVAMVHTSTIPDLDLGDGFIEQREGKKASEMQKSLKGSVFYDSPDSPVQVKIVSSPVQTGEGTDNRAIPPEGGWKPTSGKVGMVMFARDKDGKMQPVDFDPKTKQIKWLKAGEPQPFLTDSKEALSDANAVMQLLQPDVPSALGGGVLSPNPPGAIRPPTMDPEGFEARRRAAMRQHGIDVGG